MNTKKGNNKELLTGQESKEQVDNCKDSLRYASLVESDPDGKEYLSQEEQKDFENWLCLS